MVEVTVYLKSGQSMTFECESIEIIRDVLGRIKGYNVKHGDSKKRLVELDIDSIAGIIVKDLKQEG